MVFIDIIISIIILLFDRLPLNVFQCDWCPMFCTCDVLILFFYLFAGVAARGGWVVDTAGHRGGSIQQGLGCWQTAGLFWAPDLHLRQMLLIERYILIPDNDKNNSMQPP